MLTLDDYKYRLKNLNAKFDDCKLAFDVDKMKEKAASLDEIRQSPDFYSEPKKLPKSTPRRSISPISSTSLTATRRGLTTLPRLSSWSKRRTTTATSAKSRKR